MTRQVLLRGPQAFADRRKLLRGDQENSRRGGKKRVGEVVGGTAAECAAVCCCCPCGLVNLLVLAVYRVPAGLCRKALRRNRRRKLMKKGLSPPSECGCSEVELLQLHTPMANPMESDKDVAELEKEMWDKFYSAGFWRSPSQRSDL